MNKPEKDKAQALVDQLLSQVETLLDVADSAPLEQRYARARLARMAATLKEYRQEVLRLTDRMDKAHEWAQQYSKRLRRLEESDNAAS